MDSKQAIPDVHPAQIEIRPPQQNFMVVMKSGPYHVHPAQIEIRPPQPNFMVVMEYGPYPIQLACPHCYAPILTRTQYEAGFVSWMLCIFIACCALCCNFTKDVHHYCPACNKWLGRYRRGCTRQIITLIVAVLGVSFILGAILGVILGILRFIMILKTGH